MFKIAFIIFISFISIKMLFGSDRWNLDSELPGRMLLAFYGLITGLFSSLVGVSGGSVSNAVLTMHGQPMQRAVATSAGIGVPITIAGTVGYMVAGWSPGATATAVDRLRVVDWLCADGAGVELYGELRRAAGTLAAAAQARDRLRLFTDPGSAAVYSQLGVTALTDCRACAAGRRAPPNFPAG